MSNDVAQNQEVDWSRETTDLMTNSNFTDTPEITREILTSDAVQQKDMYQETINRVIENLGLAVGNAKKKLDKSFEEKPMPEVGGFTEEGLEQEVEKFVSPTITDKQTEEALTDAEITDIASSAIDAAGKAQDNQPNLDDVTTTSDAQRMLSDLGYVEVGDVDGIVGTNTRTAIRRYQQQNELTITGRLDATTVESLTGAEADLDTVVQRQIAHHEGKKNYPYKDSKGLWTIGIGHLIGNGTDESLAASEYSEYSESNPMPDSEVTELFEEDLEEHKAIAEGYDFYEDMSKKGKRAILDLTFNMGDFYNRTNENGDFEWANLRTQLDDGNWDAAANNLASSAYARQVGQRAITVTNLLRQAGD